MSSNLIVTKEISPLPVRADDAHKGEVGRLVIIGGYCDDTTAMVGAPALAAGAAFRSGIGLCQLMVPQAIRTAVSVLVPSATLRSLPTDAAAIIEAVEAFGADVVALGPGLGTSLPESVIAAVLTRFSGPVVLDADGLNLLAKADPFDIPRPGRVVLTPHPGEMRRLLSARGRDLPVDNAPNARRAAALALFEAYGCVVVLKGRGTIVTDGRRLYVNETGNSGMASGGTGDVLTGVIAALIGQKLNPFEAAILGVHLHGLAGDFAAEELGRRSVVAMDIVEFLADAFCEHELSDE